METTSITVFRSEALGPCSERQLVLQAVGIESELLRDEHGHALYVSDEDFATAREELSAYATENEATPLSDTLRHPDYFPANVAMIGYAIALIGMAIVVETGWFGQAWYQIGKINSERVLGGELWRLVTALGLHVDLAHITANLGFGIALLYATGRFFGSGLALLAVISSATLGNALNVVMKGPGLNSVGASTAVFAALGLAGLYSWRLRLFPQRGWAQRLGPIIGALALLAYSGTGGERTDIGAHFWGFVAGAALGWFFAAHSDSLRRDRQAQTTYGMVAAVIFCGAWVWGVVATS